MNVTAEQRSSCHVVEQLWTDARCRKERLYLASLGWASPKVTFLKLKPIQAQSSNRQGPGDDVIVDIGQACILFFFIHAYNRCQ